MAVMVILLLIKYVINSLSAHYVGHWIGGEGSGCTWEAYLLNPGAICHNSKLPGGGPRKPGHQPPPPYPGAICDDESRLRPMRRSVGAAFLTLAVPFDYSLAELKNLDF